MGSPQRNPTKQTKYWVKLGFPKPQPNLHLLEPHPQPPPISKVYPFLRPVALGFRGVRGGGYDIPDVIRNGYSLHISFQLNFEKVLRRIIDVE
ncbi:hypothetical protein A2T98_18210 [Nodularia spumigena CENA596]|uniref:Uncharacterized protein n=1 Tax=Nodularia spumigena CENA596 TaxID=1819295 RepID=A0A166IH59_NODSP|nr:hypothetical protein A2T98_18210 [Nodularia spumigena CENA596]